MKRVGSLLKYLLLLLAGGLAGAGVTWLVVSQYGRPFQANATRDVEVRSLLRHPWAQGLDRPGLPNLHKVSDVLYRGAQPKEAGYASLKQLGVKTVVNLRESGQEQAQVERAGLQGVRIASDAWDMTDDNVIAFLKVVTDPSCQPVFVHCRHGADRTGTVCAAYRIVVQGWSKGEAVLEMTRGGFGFHTNFENLVQYVEKLDVQAIRQKAGLAQTQPAAAAQEPN